MKGIHLKTVCKDWTPSLHTVFSEVLEDRCQLLREACSFAFFALSLSQAHMCSTMPSQS